MFFAYNSNDFYAREINSMISIFNPVPHLYDDMVRIIEAIPEPKFQLDHIDRDQYRLFFSCSAKETEDTVNLVKYSLMRGNPMFMMVVMNIDIEETTTRIKNGISLMKIK